MASATRKNHQHAAQFCRALALPPRVRCPDRSSSQSWPESQSWSRWRSSFRCPAPVQLRDWAESVGPWFPLAFLLAHIVVTVVPVPRTAFTLAAGLLFGPVLGCRDRGGRQHRERGAGGAAGARGRVAAEPPGSPPGGRQGGRAAAQRGWRAVLSLRLIPVVPFSALNYAAGASAVRLLPYTLATLAGLLPGTAAVVILGDALAGHASPMLYLVSVCTGALGLAGLVLEIRHYRQHHRTTVTRTTKPPPRWPRGARLSRHRLARSRPEVRAPAPCVAPRRTVRHCAARHCRPAPLNREVRTSCGVGPSPSSPRTSPGTTPPEWC